jgi:hypothetical protein
MQRFIRSPGMAAAAVTVAAALTVASCASSGGDPLSHMSAAQIDTMAIADVNSGSAFTVVGSGIDGKGQTMTLHLGFADKDCTGTVNYGPMGTMTMILIGSTIWLEPNATFWRTQSGSQGAELAKTMAGKWIEAPTSNANASPSVAICNPQQLTNDIPDPAAVAKGGLTTINGQRVLALTDKAEDTTIYVTDTLTPRVVKVVSTLKTDDGQFAVTYGKPASVSAPPASQIVNGAQFGF